MRTKPKHGPDSKTQLRNDLREKWGLIPLSSLWAWYPWLSMSTVTVIINDVCCYSSHFGRMSFYATALIEMSSLLVRALEKVWSWVERPGGSSPGFNPLYPEKEMVGSSDSRAPKTLAFPASEILLPINSMTSKTVFSWTLCSQDWAQGLTPQRSLQKRRPDFQKFGWARLRSQIFLVDVPSRGRY